MGENSQVVKAREVEPSHGGFHETASLTSDELKSMMLRSSIRLPSRLSGSKKRLLMLKFAVPIVLLLAAVLAVSELSNPGEEGLDDVLAKIMLGLVGFWVVLSLTVYVFLKVQISRSVSKLGEQIDINFGLTKDWFTANTAGHKVSMRWDTIEAWQEHVDCIVWTKFSVRSVIPTQQFSDEGLAYLKERLATQIAGLKNS